MENFEFIEERYASCCLSGHDQLFGGRVMISAGCGIVVELYRNQLSPVVILVAGKNNLTFQDDNTPTRRAHVMRTAKERSQMDVLPWPSCSPDPSHQACIGLDGQKNKILLSHPPSNIACARRETRRTMGMYWAKKTWQILWLNNGKKKGLFFCGRWACLISSFQRESSHNII